jgi:hypothetical protein
MLAAYYFPCSVTDDGDMAGQGRPDSPARGDWGIRVNSPRKNDFIEMHTKIDKKF